MLVKMLDQAQYELLHFPHRSLGYHLGRPFRALFSPGKDPYDRMSFGNGCLAKAMMDYYKKHVNSEEAKEIMNIVRRYYDKWYYSGRRLHYIDDLYAGVALIDLQKITGSERYKKGIDEMVKFANNFPTDPNGAFVYRPRKKEPYISAETIGAVCPFLAKYAATYDDMGVLSLAVNQVQNFLEFGMDEKTILPYHGYNYETGMKMGIIGWGQAVGKIMMGMSEMLYYMTPDNPSYEVIRMAYRRIVDKVEIYQTEGGLYSWQLGAKDGPADTAASAMILYSIAQSLDDKILIGIHKSRMMRGVEALKVCVLEDGSLPGASKEAKGFNNYPIEFDTYPWALGPAMSLFNILEEEPKNIE